MKSSTVAAAVIFVLTELLHPCPMQAAPLMKTVIITMRAKSDPGTHVKMLQALGAKLVKKIVSNGNSPNEFLALVVRVPALRLPHLVAGKAMAGSHQDVKNLLPGVPPGDVICAPLAPNVPLTCRVPTASIRSAACRAEASSRTGIPVSNSASVSFGVRYATCFRRPWGSGAAG